MVLSVFWASPGSENPAQEAPGGENPAQKPPGGQNPAQETPGGQHPAQEAMRPESSPQNVAKTLEIVTLAKINWLWPQNGDRVTTV